ncbi:MAG: zinc-ribbon domain-containing protein [Holosporaceae bacterium]
MVITCPTCSKRYYIDAADLEEARPVRCTACQSVWIAEKKDQKNLPILDLGQQPKASSYKGFARKLKSHQVAHASPNEKTVKQRLPFRQSVFFTIATSGLLLLTFFGISTERFGHLSLFKNLSHPFAAKFLDAVLPAKKTTVAGIQMRNLKLHLNPQTNRFTVEGHLFNTSTTAIDLKPLKIKLLDLKDASKALPQKNQKHPLPLETREVIFHQLPQQTLQAGSSLSFSYVLPKVIPWLRGVSVTF